MTFARRRRAVLAAAVAAAALTGACTSAVPGGPSPRPSASSPPSTASSSTMVSPSTSSPPSTPTTSPHRHRRHHHRSPTPTLTPPTPTSASPLPPTSAPPPAPKSTCRSVSVRVIPGGAAEGTEIAALQFTNDGKRGCTLVGYPTVVLRKNGKKIGTPSQPGGPLPGRSVPVAPGQTVQSMLRDYSSCQAPLSDTARVTVPGESKTVVRPIELRACTLRVGQLGPPR